ncbi:pentatricopeptide repeat protein [Didymella exigua CBS 183.55]|uniref:Pentatricopeptide repeat protein n=1 Tax=Didymella exigua CBS 183.55 TaxID=1150837 RepID=A0A6A5RZP7_9PLEO|nr:pentatricopeptide repeat protein [Didymella exigua CBS 183.55]KAF1930737.1 pentatricopeptide repeat protein [Didymella exigua CBS 183.55]
MVFKSFSLARTSLAKGFTHGYAQSVVAGVSQNNPLATLQHDRFRKGHKQQYAFASNSTTSAIKALDSARAHEHQDSGLAAYYTAWQKTQKTEDKEWSQYQFRKLIEYDPKHASKEAEAKAAEAAAEEASEPNPARAGVNRAYSTSQVEDFKKAVGDEQAEEIALAQVDEAIAQEAAKIRAVNEAIREAETRLSPIQERTVTPANLSDTANSASLSYTPPSSLLPSPFDEIEEYTAHLEKLAANRKYAEIPAVFESMLLDGVKPSTTAYNYLLSAAINLPRAKHQVVPKALDVYSDMLRRRVAPDTATYTALIELLSVRSLEVVSMSQVYEEKRLRYGGLEEEGKFMLQSNETDYAILAEDSSLGVAVKLFDAAIKVEAGQKFSERTYRLLVTACAEGERVEDMVRIYSHMESRKVTPAGDMFVPMIHAFGKSGDLRSAVECFDEYKALAMANDNGSVQLVRKDKDVYAALIKAYATCDRMEGGQKFLRKVEAALIEAEDITSLRDIVGLKALLPVWLNSGSFKQAYVHATESLSPQAQHIAMAAICIKAADRNVMDIATEAFDALPAEADLARPAMAMGAMHTRNGNIEAAEIFWRMLELSPTKPDFIEPTAMHSVALIGSGQAERGLRQGRQMFDRIRDTQSGSQAKMEIVEHIDEAIEVMGQFMMKRGIFLPPRASMELMWTMIENGGLVTPVAHHLLSGMGPEAIAQLNFDDVTLLMQVQSGIILQSAEVDAAHAARFAHLLEVITSVGSPVNKTTSGLVEKVLAALDRGDLQHRWYSYKHPAPESMYSPAPFAAYPAPGPGAPGVPAFEDQYDPYAASTDNKGSVVIAELLEKTHGRTASHLNEALMKFKNMRRAGRHPRFFTYAKLITAAAKEDRLSLAHDILNLAKQDIPLLPQYRIVRYGWVTILDAMVAACLTCGQRDLAARYHQDLLDMGAAPTANTFGLYITTLKESTKTFDEATEAVKIFLRAKSEGVEPSSFLYNALIGKLGKARRIDDCLFYFSEMRSLGIRPTSVTYGTIVNALCRVSDEKFAEELFEEMESMPNYKPRPAPYHSMMQFFLTTKRDRSKVLGYYERMRSKRIEPTTHTYKLLIDTYATLEPVDMEAAERVLEQVRTAGAVPEAVHYSSLIHAKGCVAHDMDGARQLFETVLADARIRPQACLYQALFESMVANHQIEATDAVLANMHARRVEMTPYIANSLIHGWALAQNIDKAKAIYESVPEARREPSTYEAMTRAYMAVEDRASAMQVVNEGLSRGYPAAVAGKILELVGGGRQPAEMAA